MAFHGDLSSYPLPELLQWLDSSRKTGALQLGWDSGERKLFLLGGQIVATASPGLWERLSRTLEVGQEASGTDAMAALSKDVVATSPLGPSLTLLAQEDLIGAVADLTHAQGGRFHWTEDPDRGDDEWVPLTVSLRHVLFESMLRVDESADVERVLSSDTLMVRATSRAVPGNVLHRVIHRLAQRPGEAGAGGVPLGRLWLTLGLTRGVVLRAVYDLLRSSKVVVEGAAEIIDNPVVDMLEKGAVLLRERQFDAAALVFSSLLTADPTDRRVREFARMVEREHAASIYRELPPVTRFEVSDDPRALSLLRPEERPVVEQLRANWDISAVVLAGHRRELETLKLLAKLVRAGVVNPRPAPDA